MAGGIISGFAKSPFEATVIDRYVDVLLRNTQKEPIGISVCDVYVGSVIPLKELFIIL